MLTSNVSQLNSNCLQQQHTNSLLIMITITAQSSILNDTEFEYDYSSIINTNQIIFNVPDLQYDEDHFLSDYKDQILFEYDLDDELITNVSIN